MASYSPHRIRVWIAGKHGIGYDLFDNRPHDQTAVASLYALHGISEVSREGKIQSSYTPRSITTTEGGILIATTAIVIIGIVVNVMAVMAVGIAIGSP